jgi:hypothetical protein
VQFFSLGIFHIPCFLLFPFCFISSHFQTDQKRTILWYLSLMIVCPSI